MAVKGDNVTSKSCKLPPVLLQVDNMSSIASTAQVDSIAKEWACQAGTSMFKFRRKVDVNILGQVDNQLGVSLQGLPALDLNSLLISNPQEMG